MKLKADEYYAREIGRDSPPFARWRFRKMRAEARRWRTRVSTVYVSISALEGKIAGVEVHSGKSLRGRKRGNRRARARRLLFYLTLPPYRNFRTRAVKALICEARSALDKCEAGARYATERGLTFCLAPDLARAVEERGELAIPPRCYLLTSTNEASGTAS